MGELQRIEYPISGKYCENWGMVEALREIIANMLDARSVYRHTQNRGTATFADAGPGFDARCLMLGEGEDKDGNQIGQFKEGLKLALLTLARLGKRVALETTQFAVRTAAMEMTGLGEKGLVLYVDRDAKRERGTEIRVQCTKKDYQQAVGMFLQLMDPGPALHRCDVTSARVFARRKNQKWGNVYVNGLLTEQKGRWAFDYDLVGRGIKGAMNRDRTALNRNEVDWEIAKIWANCSNVHAIRLFIDATRQHNCAECGVYTSRSHMVCPSRDRTWREAIEAELGIDYDNLVIDDGRTQMVRECKERGFVPIIPEDKLGLPAGLIVRDDVPTATSKWMDIRAEADKKANRKKKRKQKEDFGPYEVVDWKDVPESAVECLNEAASVVRHVVSNAYPYGLKSNLENPPYFVYEKDHTGSDSKGCAYRGKVGIRLDELTRSYVDVGGLVGTILHELVHLMNPEENMDCTRAFENVMTDMLGNVAYTHASTEEMSEIDVRYKPNSKYRIKSAPTTLNPEILSFGDIQAAVKKSLNDAKADWAKDIVEDWGNPKSVERARTLAWHYHGAQYDTDARHTRSGVSTSTTYIFLAQGKNPGRIYSMSLTIHDGKSKRTKRRSVKVSYLWSPTRVRRWVLGRGTDYTVSYKESPLKDQWPEMGAMMESGAVPQSLAASSGG